MLDGHPYSSAFPSEPGASRSPTEPEDVDQLLMIAEHGTASHLERLIRGFRRVERAEERERADEQHRNRELSC